MSAIDSLPSIFDCQEYTKRRWPPYHDNFSRLYNAMMPIVFSFAYTPTGRISKYFCSLSFHYPNPSEDRIREWEDRERPRLPKGYRWSRVFAYQRYIK